MAVRHENSHYRSQRDQALHYFARPHAGPCPGPIDSPAAWLGRDMRNRGDWLYRFTTGDVAEIQAALEHANETDKATLERTAAECPLGFVGNQVELTVIAALLGERQTECFCE